MIKRLSYQIKRHIFDILSLDRMSDKFHILAANYIFLMIYGTIEGIFVNTLLYRITPDISIVILYRGIAYAASAVMMNFAAMLGHKKNPVVIARIGALLYLLMYVVLFFGMEHMRTLMYVTAILSGAGGAFYWSGHNLLIPHYTKPNNRDIGVSIMCIIQGVAALFVPIISGGVISLSGALFGSTGIGYRIMFGVGMITVISQIQFQRKLPVVEALPHKSEFKLSIKLFTRNASFKNMIVYEYLRGFRDGAFAFILNMILFRIITSESLVGVNAFLTGIMAIVGAWAYGKLVMPSLRTRYTVIATTVMLIFCAILLVNSSAAVVMLFAMINSFFALFISNAVSNCSIDVMTQNRTCRKCLAESLSMREACLALGRISGLVVILLFPDTIFGNVLAMFILTIAQYILAFFLNRSSKILTRKNNRDVGDEN